MSGFGYPWNRSGRGDEEEDEDPRIPSWRRRARNDTSMGKLPSVEGKIGTNRHRSCNLHGRDINTINDIHGIRLT